MPRGSAPGEHRGGRKKGSRNKRTQELQQAMAAAAKQIEAVIARAFQGDAHALLMAIYKDESRSIELRLEAAKAAIAYEKPKLAAVESTIVHKQDPDDYSNEELMEIVRRGDPNKSALLAHDVAASYISAVLCGEGRHDGRGIPDACWSAGCAV